MYVRIALLKILTSYPDGRASYDSLKSDFSMLATQEWLARMRVLAARSGWLNIYAELATRDMHGLMITEAGREFLGRLERGEIVPKKPAGRPTLKLISSPQKTSRRAFC